MNKKKIQKYEFYLPKVHKKLKAENEISTRVV